jgi:hypothetical protein
LILIGRLGVLMRNFLKILLEKFFQFNFPGGDEMEKGENSFLILEKFVELFGI